VTTATDLEAEFYRFGQNTADVCHATFVTLLASKTKDPQLIAAAESGRLEVLADSVAGVHIVVATERTTVARVRADDGLHDVTRGHLTGWTCSCNEVGPCCHILATQQITAGVGQ
jgi:hypothetical protein